MVADHVQRGLGHVILDHVVQVFIVPPGQADIVQTAILSVDAKMRAITWTLAVRVVLEEFRENNLVGKRRANRKRVAHHGPLRLAKKAKDFPQVMDEAGKDEPSRMTIASNL